jgi:hypothetical protein
MRQYDKYEKYADCPRDGDNLGDRDIRRSTVTLLDSDDYQAPVAAPEDRAHAVVRTALGSVPLVGKTGAELFQYIIAPPLERRLNEWRNAIAAGLRRLEADRGLDLGALPNNQAFVDAVLTATQMAIKTSQARRLEALRNAVANAGLQGSPSGEVIRPVVRRRRPLVVWREPREW